VSARTDKSDDSRRAQHAPSFPDWNSHENVTGEKRQLDFYPSITPAPKLAVRRKVALDRLSLEAVTYCPLMPRTGVNHIPMWVTRSTEPSIRNQCHLGEPGFGKGSASLSHNGSSPQKLQTLALSPLGFRGNHWGPSLPWTPPTGKATKCEPESVAIALRYACI
jgi:hypothetical protein